MHSFGSCVGVPAAAGLKRRRIALLVCAALGQASFPALAAPEPLPAPDPSPEPAPAPDAMEFSSAFLAPSTTSVDLSRFERGNAVLPGDYLVDIYVNGYRLKRQTLQFLAPPDGGNARACLSGDLLTALGVNTRGLVAAGIDLSQPCIDVATAIPDARVDFDMNQLRLDLSIPQVSMDQKARGYVDPALWDRGVDAFTLGYNLSANRLDYVDGGSTTGAYAGLNLGLNLGGWRLRNQSSYNWQRDGGGDYQNIRTYAEHDVQALQSQFTIGDTFTSGELYDSTGFRGVKLATDDRMWPDSMRGYAPTVRGVAQTNAKVVIRQAGYVIYETNVAPGSFAIDDLYATGYGGDLDVTVIEADGRERTFTVPYAAVPQLLRPGTSRYSAVAGRVRDDSLIGQAPYFLEATYQRGLSNAVTAYAGLQSTDSTLYRSLLAGAAFNTPVGAVSLDVTGSATTFSVPDNEHRGYSARVTYSKSIPQTYTDFALAAYRYSSRGFLSLGDAVRLDDEVRYGTLNGGVTEGSANQRSRFQLTVSQRLGDRGGSLYVSGARNDYWYGERPVDSSYQIGWNRQFRDVTLGVNANRARLAGAGYDDQFYVSLAMPLGSSSYTRRPPQLNFAAGHDRDGTSVQAGVNGQGGANEQFSYGVNGNFNDRNTDSVGINAGWRTALATLGGSYTYGTDSRQASLTANGGVVVHRGGITLAPVLGDTIGIVDARGASGAHVQSDRTTKVDGRGYAVVGNLSPYRINEVVLDPKGLSADVELVSSRAQIVPRAGAVVPLKFVANVGHATLINARLENGEFVPFGAQVDEADGTDLGIVGQGGQMFVRRVDGQNGLIRVTWGADAQVCLIDAASATPRASRGGVAVIDAVCTPSRGGVAMQHAATAGATRVEALQ